MIYLYHEEKRGKDLQFHLLEFDTMTNKIKKDL